MIGSNALILLLGHFDIAIPWLDMAEQQPNTDTAAKEASDEEQVRLKYESRYSACAHDFNPGFSTGRRMGNASVQVVDPWSVSGGADGRIDYNKLLEQVGDCHLLRMRALAHLTPLSPVL